MTTDSRAAFDAWIDTHLSTATLELAFDAGWSARQGEIDALRSALAGLVDAFDQGRLLSAESSSGYINACVATARAAIDTARATPTPEAK